MCVYMWNEWRPPRRAGYGEVRLLVRLFWGICAFDLDLMIKRRIQLMARWTGMGGWHTRRCVSVRLCVCVCVRVGTCVRIWMCSCTWVSMCTVRQVKKTTALGTFMKKRGYDFFAACFFPRVRVEKREKNQRSRVRRRRHLSLIR